MEKKGNRERTGLFISILGGRLEGVRFLGQR